MRRNQWPRPPGTKHIGQNDRVTGGRDHPFQRLDAIVEIMITQGGRVIPQPVHRRDHRMGQSTGHQIGQRRIAKRRPLKGIAIVEQQDIRAFGPRLHNRRRQPRKPHAIIGTVGVVVV